ncbi:MAG: UDP-N-acetylglucosamine--N-acetylmuramyl-(pentapeptide) pyrophosphoryl-undecaprenol N-acetylglucosamine transferase [Acidimicrobiales bacterium]
MSEGRYALVAGGGTAGHLQPALAIAEALVDAGHGRDSIEFVGSRRGQDRVTLEGRGFPFTLLPGRGIARGRRAVDIWRNLGAVSGLLVATVRAFALVVRARPRVVVSVGGYASLPASSAAVLLGVPLVLVNVDAVPGAANRLFGRFARASAVGWPGSPLPRSVVTGTPVRPAIADVDRGPDARRQARRSLGLPADRPTVAVFGGSLGARRLNDAAAGLVERWKDRTDRSIFHIVGRRDWDRCPPTGGDSGGGGTGKGPGLSVVSVPFEDRMDLVYRASDLVVCRAGAMTVAELAVAGVPSILVPLPGAPGDHQTANARVLQRVGAALLLPDPECEAATLAESIDRLLDDPPGLEAMGRAARSMGRPDAAAAGAGLVEANARPEPARRSA